MSVGQACPVDEMVEIAEGRNRLRLLQGWLENRVATGSTEPATHNGLGKIYLSQNIEPRQFLENNMFYEPAVLGKFCEGLDPSLAFAAYQKVRARLVRCSVNRGDDCVLDDEIFKWLILF